MSSPRAPVGEKAGDADIVVAAAVQRQAFLMQSVDVCPAWWGDYARDYARTMHGHCTKLIFRGRLFLDLTEQVFEVTPRTAQSREYVVF